MADQSTQSIVIDADAETIMEVISDFPAYPQWAGAVKLCEVTQEDENGWAEQVHFKIDAGVLKDDYVLEYDWSAYPDAVSWTLVKGQMQKAQQGTYAMSPSGTSTKVTYTLSVDLSIPMLGMMKRKAEKVIMDTALKDLKRRVESS